MRFNLFVSKIEDIKVIQKFSERTNTLCGQTFEDLTFLPYQVLKHTIPALINDSKFEKAYHLILNYKKKTNFIRVKWQSNYVKLKFLFWIQDQYIRIGELEEEYLSGTPDIKLINAGIRELDILGDVNMIDVLCKGDPLKWKAMRQLPYSMLFEKQLRNTIEKRVFDKLNKK